jgi:hypothetical protein
VPYSRATLAASGVVINVAPDEVETGRIADMP